MLVVLQAVAVIVTAVSWLPQWWRTFRRGGRGLSIVAWAQAAALGGTWFIWGVQAQVWSMAVSEGAFTLGCVIILGATLPRRRFTAAAVTALAAAAAAAAYIPTTWLGIAGVVGSTCIRGAQVVTMLRTGASDGVSTLTWLLLALSGSVWGVVGLLTREWILVVGATIGIATTALLAMVAAHVAHGSDSNTDGAAHEALGR